MKDLAQHLLGDDIGVLSRQRDGQPGFAIATQGGGPPSWEEIVAAVNANNALWVEATRRISPRLLIERARIVRCC